MRVKLVGVKQVNKRLADGSVKAYFYHRATMTPLAGKPGTAEFATSFAEAGRNAVLAKSAGTVEWLIRRYQASAAWSRLAASTREIGAVNLRAVEAKWGSMPLAVVNQVPQPGKPNARTILLNWHEELATQHPRAADAKLSALNTVFAWALDRGHHPLPDRPVQTRRSKTYADGDRLMRTPWINRTATSGEALTGKMSDGLGQGGYDERALRLDRNQRPRGLRASRRDFWRSRRSGFH